MTLGERIAVLRKSRGMTQGQLAELLFTTRQAVSKWEGDKSLPDIECVIQMGEIFGVSMDYLLLGKCAIDEEVRKSVLTERNLESANNTVHKGLFSFFLFIGCCIIFFLPFIAIIYRNLISSFEPTYTNPYLYLLERPLVCIVILGVVLVIIGIVCIRKHGRKTD